MSEKKTGCMLFNYPKELKAGWRKDIQGNVRIGISPS